MSDFVAGLKYGFAGFGLIKRPGVRLYVLIPLAINVLLFAAAIVYGAQYLSGLIDQISAQWAWVDWVIWLLWPVFVLIALTIMFFGFSIVANFIGAPFNGFLSAAVERALTGVNTAPADGPGILKELLDAVRGEIRKLGYMVVRAVPLLLLFFIPLVQVAAPFVWFLFGAWMLALEYLDYPYGNRGMTFPDVRRKAQEKRSLVLGFGVSVFAITMVPVANFIAMPVAVAGATKMWSERLRNP